MVMIEAVFSSTGMIGRPCLPARIAATIAIAMPIARYDIKLLIQYGFYLLSSSQSQRLFVVHEISWLLGTIFRSSYLIAID